MTAYLIKRLLIMVPTFFGVSLAIWLVMTLAPGDPSASKKSGFGEDATQDVSNLERENREVRMFRTQFGLDRPRFLNTWTDLDGDDVREQLEIVAGGVSTHGSGAVKKAQQKLDDWGNYSVPALVSLLPTLEGDVQDRGLLTLRKAAYVFKPIYAEDYQPTDEEIERDTKTDIANEIVKNPDYFWEPDAPAEKRDTVLANWQTWYEEKQAEGRWSYQDSTMERVGIALTDTQFGHYWSNVLTGDLGISYSYGTPVKREIEKRLKYSLSLAVPSFIIAYLLAVFLGVTSAARHNSRYDRSVALTVFMLYSIPSFLMATVLQQGLAVDLGWFPTSRFESADAQQLNTWDHLKDILRHITLPMMCYTYGSLAYISRQARSGMLEVLQSDFVRTARAKGLSERAVVWKHAARNGMIPIITLLGTALPVLLGGSVVIEYIFEIDGFGLLMLNAIFNKDYNVVMGVALVSAVLTLVGLLVADLLYAAVDPRVSY